MDNRNEYMRLFLQFVYYSPIMAWYSSHKISHIWTKTDNPT